MVFRSTCQSSKIDYFLSFERKEASRTNTEKSKKKLVTLIFIFFIFSVDSVINLCVDDGNYCILSFILEIPLGALSFSVCRSFIKVPFT